jgi:hypothetical protein
VQPHLNLEHQRGERGDLGRRPVLAVRQVVRDVQLPLVSLAVAVQVVNVRRQSFGNQFFITYIRSRAVIYHKPGAWEALRVYWIQLVQ